MLIDRREFFAIGRRGIITTPGLRINPRVIDIPGSDVNIALGAMSMMGEEVSARFAHCSRGNYVETAEGDQLDRVAYDRYQATRLPANPASVDVRLSFPAAGPIGTYPAGSRIQTTAGTQFATDIDAVFTGAESNVIVPATALVTGPGSNVPEGALTQFVEQPFNSTMTLTNTEDAAGGTDQEEDPDFRARVLGFFATIRRGILDAIEYGARQVAGIAVAKAYEVTNTCSSGNVFPAAMVQLVISDKNGGSSSKLIQRVNDILLTYRAAGIPVDVIRGVKRPETVEWSGLGYLTGYNQKAVQDELRAVTVAVSQFLRPGDVLYRSALIAGGKTVPGAVISNATLALPLGDVFPNNNTELIRVAPEAVLFT